MSPTINENSSDDVRRFDSDGNLSEIRILAGRKPDIVSALGEALAATIQPVYVSGGRLVELIEHYATDTRVARSKEALIIHPISPLRLMELAGKACSWSKWDGRSSSYVPTDCPRQVAEMYLERGHWPELPELQGFTESPYLDINGRLIEHPGFNHETGIFLSLSKDISGLNIPRKPTRQHSINAVKVLRNHLSEFQFVSEEDEAAALAALISTLQRRILPAAPGFAISATAAGTGKTTLAEVCTIVATGRRPAVLSIGQDPQETEKRIVGVLLAGDPVVLLDNISEPVGGDLLCQVLSQPKVKVRPLGGSGSIEVPSGSTMFFTGNALSIKGDLKRRVLLIRMDAGLENPEQRKFKRDILEDTYRQRGPFISAALTISAAYLTAGEPEIEGWHPFGSFGAWDRMVRRPLMWAGLPDPLGTSQALKDVDPEIEAMRMMIDAWNEAFKAGGSHKLSDVIAKSGSVEAGAAKLKDALNYICSEKITSRRLAGWLRRNRDRIIDGRRFVLAAHDNDSKVGMWKLEKC